MLKGKLQGIINLSLILILKKLKINLFLNLLSGQYQQQNLVRYPKNSYLFNRRKISIEHQDMIVEVKLREGQEKRVCLISNSLDLGLVKWEVDRDTLKQTSLLRP